MPLTFKKGRKKGMSIRKRAISNLKKIRKHELPSSNDARNGNTVANAENSLVRSQSLSTEHPNLEVVAPSTSAQFHDVELLVEPMVDSAQTNKEAKPSGRRIIDIEYFVKQMQCCNNHFPFSCNLSDMEFTAERQEGLISHFTLICKMCNVSKTIATESPDLVTNSMNINSAAVLAAISTGRGHSEMTQEQAILNIPQLSYRQYSKHHQIVAQKLYDSMCENIIQAGREELELAQQVGDVDEDGNGLITVIADGAWSKRSYKVNYDAPSGVACIVGAKTGKILFLATRNKYCSICSRAESTNETAPEHVCFKNWNGSSTSMETDIILEGFKKSTAMHRLKYIRLVGDGDSSVYKRLCEAKPYGFRMMVKKVECTNHLLRNYCSRLRDLTRKKVSSKSKHVSVELRKILFTRIERLRRGVKSSILYNRKRDILLNEQISMLSKDITNCPFHVFGCHDNCQEYFCTGSKDGEKNYVPDMKLCGLMDDMLSCGSRLVQNSHSLILNMNNNAAETYNSIVAKFVGGKRINFSLKNSYDVRCQAAALSYNIKERYYSDVHKSITNKSPGKYTKEYIRKLRLMREYRNSRKQLFRTVPKRKRKSLAPADDDYGVQELDTEDVTITSEENKNNFLESISKTAEEIKKLEENTRGQSHNSLWKTERCYRLTASNFGQVCKRRVTTNPNKMVKRILNASVINSKAIQWGKDHELIAINEFEQQYKQTVRECGLFVYEDCCYLGASPDGVIDDETIVEIKCPYAASKLTPEQAIVEKKITYIKLENGVYFLKKTHNYYYQVQGQLTIGNFRYCYFVVWTPFGMIVDKVPYLFWEYSILYVVLSECKTYN